MSETLPEPIWKVGSGFNYGLTEIRCLAGQRRLPTTCTRHHEHFWCDTCEGYYGVPHDDTHTKYNRHGGPGVCVCRPCREANARGLTGSARTSALTANGTAWHPEFPDAPQLR